MSKIPPLRDRARPNHVLPPQAWARRVEDPAFAGPCTRLAAFPRRGVVPTPAFSLSPWPTRSRLAGERVGVRAFSLGSGEGLREGLDKAL